MNRLIKHNTLVTAAKELEFYMSRIEGQLFLLTYDKVEGFRKINKGYYRECASKAQADMILKKIAKETEITNLDELSQDYRKRFGTKLDVEKLESLMPKAKTKETKPESKKDTDNKPASSKYNGKQIVLGLLTYATKEKRSKAAYNLWISEDVGGMDFKKMLEKKGVATVAQSVKYLLENDNKTTEKIIDWINGKRKSVVVRFLNAFKEQEGLAFSKLEPIVKLISK